MSNQYLIGLDLGQAQDPTALCVLEKIQPMAEEVHWSTRIEYASGDPHYQGRHLERFRLGTTYPAIVERVRVLTLTPPLAGHCRLIVDATGVGRAVVDLLVLAGLAPIAITITGGNTATQSGDDLRVPKRDLVGVLQVLLQAERLKFASALPLVPLLMTELQNFKVKITDSAHDVYGAWREGEHDDLVLAVTLAAWWGEKQEPVDSYGPNPVGDWRG